MANGPATARPAQARLKTVEERILKAKMGSRKWVMKGVLRIESLSAISNREDKVYRMKVGCGCGRKVVILRGLEV